MRYPRNPPSNSSWRLLLDASSPLSAIAIYFESYGVNVKRLQLDLEKLGLNLSCQSHHRFFQQDPSTVSIDADLRGAWLGSLRTTGLVDTVCNSKLQHSTAILS